MINIMKRILGIINALSLALFAFPQVVFAQANQPLINCGSGQFKKLCELDAGKFGPLVAQLVTIAFVGGILIALGFLIYGGFKWITSGGEKTALEEARNHIVASIVGLVIIFLSYFILNLIVFFFTGKGLTTITFPQIDPSSP